MEYWFITFLTGGKSAYIWNVITEKNPVDYLIASSSSRDSRVIFAIKLQCKSKEILKRMKDSWCFDCGVFL